MCVSWHLANPTTICLLWGGDEVPHSVAQDGCGHASGHGGPAPTIDANLALSLLYVSEVLFQHCVFIGDSDTKIQWVEVCGFLLLVIGNRCHLLNMMVATHFVMLVTTDDPA